MSAVSAVQELTVAGMQARVMSVLESIGAAMPGVGYLLGGVIASTVEPARRPSWSPASASSPSLAVSVPAMGRKWPGSGAKDRTRGR